MADGAINRADIIAEAYPGAANAIQRQIENAGGLVCEQHPDRAWPHDDCAGPGMLRSDMVRDRGRRLEAALDDVANAVGVVGRGYLLNPARARVRATLAAI